MLEGDGRGIKVCFLIPLADNDGRDLRDEIALLDADLANAVGGYTKHPATGAWKGTLDHRGKGVHYDNSWAYFVTLPEKGVMPMFVHGELSKLLRCLREFKARTLQECIYLDICHNVEVRFT